MSKCIKSMLWEKSKSNLHQNWSKEGFISEGRERKRNSACISTKIVKFFSETIDNSSPLYSLLWIILSNNGENLFKFYCFDIREIPPPKEAEMALLQLQLPAAKSSKLQVGTNPSKGWEKLWLLVTNFLEIEEYLRTYFM